VNRANPSATRLVNPSIVDRVSPSAVGLANLPNGADQPTVLSRPIVLSRPTVAPLQVVTAAMERASRAGPPRATAPRARADALSARAASRRLPPATRGRSPRPGLPHRRAATPASVAGYRLGRSIEARAWAARTPS
jgi:hypothetical protein